MNNESNGYSGNRHFIEAATGGEAEEADEEMSGTMAEEVEQEEPFSESDHDNMVGALDDDTLVDDEAQGHEVEQEVMDTTSAAMTPGEKCRLEVLEYCNLLECKRPDICTVEMMYNLAFGECLERIGDAMLGNPHIAELLLNVAIMIDGNIDSASSSLLEFVRTSTTLRKVGVIHGFNTGYIEIDERIKELAQLMFEAIAVNKSIQELDIAGSFFMDALHRLLSTSTSIKALHIDSGCLFSNDGGHYDPFLRALSSNRSIDQLSLTIGEQGWPWLEVIPSHMGNGPSTLQRLTLIQSETFPPPFYNLLSTTSSLEILEMECSDWNEFEVEDQTRLLRAFADNKSIVHLKLHSFSEDDHGWMIDNVLLHLHNGPSTLCKLSLVSHSNSFNALQQYLCTSSASMLRHFDLEDCDMSDGSLECLVEGFRVLDSSQSTTRTQLALNSCRLSKTALHRLIEFISARNRCNRRHSQEACSMLTHELDSVDKAYPAPKLLDCQREMGDFLEVSMSTTELLRPSDGSACGLMLLSMRPNGNVPAFSDSWVTSAAMASVVCLQLWNVGPCDSTNLALWLSHTASLRALHLVDVQNDVMPQIILNGLRHNGSLLSATFKKGDDQPLFEDVRDILLIQAYCQRNRFLLEIILNKMVFWNVPLMDLKMVSDNDTNRCTVQDDTSNNRFVLVPTLFCAANAIPLTRSRLIVAALLALDLTIGL